MLNWASIDLQGNNRNEISNRFINRTISPRHIHVVAQAPRQYSHQAIAYMSQFPPAKLDHNVNNPFAVS